MPTAKSEHLYVSTVLPDWTVNTLAAHFIQLTADLGKRLDGHFSYMERWQTSDRSYMDVAMRAMEDRFSEQMVSTAATMTAALLANEKAVLKSENSVTLRFDSIERTTSERFSTFNEIRQTAADVAAKGISRTEVDSKLEAIHEKISALSSRMDKRDGTGLGMSNLWMLILGCLGAMVGIASIFHQIR